MRWIVIGVVLGALCSPLSAAAASYFEFLPDYSRSLTLASGQAVDQLFLPLNDRMSAAQFWLSDAQQPTTVRFTLLSPGGTTLAAQVIDVPAIEDGGSGAPVFVQLPSSLSVTGDATYRWRIEPVSGPVKVYYGEVGLLRPVGGSGTAYRNGTAVINGETQAYSLLFALHESAESGAPQLAGIEVRQPSTGRATIQFTANEPVDYRVVYGTQEKPWLGTTEACVPVSTPCSALLYVTPGVTYAYTLSARDAWGNESTSTGTFTAVGIGPAGGSPATPSGAPSSVTPTPSPAIDDGVAPVISNPRLVGLTSTTATFAWSTNEAATSWLVILVRPELVAHSGILDNTLELEHFVTMSGLPPGQYLRGRITSADAFGHETLVAIDFQTLPAGSPSSSPPASPVVSAPAGSVSASPGVSPTPVPSPSYSVVASPGPSVSAFPTASPTATAPPIVASVGADGNGSAHWPPAPSCEEAYGYRIDVFDADHVLIASLHADCDRTSIALPPGTEAGARVIVYADHGGAFEKIAADAVVAGPPPAPLLRYPVLTTGAILVMFMMTGGYLRLRRRDRAARPPTLPSDAPFMGGAARR